MRGGASAVVGLGLLLVAALLLCGGLFRQPWSDEVDCGGDTMRPGDICRSSRGATQTYEERVNVRENGVWLLAGGAGALVGAVVLLAAGGRRPPEGE